MTEVKSIYEDMDYYFRSFNQFKAKVDIDKIMEQWHKQWPVITNKFQFDASSEEQIRMITIGSGEGDVECNIFPSLLKRHPKVHVKVIEPSAESIELFKQTTKLQEIHPGLTIDWCCKTFEDYLESMSDKEKLNEKFHLALSGHSLYYMEKWRAAVDDMFNLVKQGGILVITLCNGESSCGRLFQKYRIIGGSEMHTLTTSDIKAHLKASEKKLEAYPRILPVNIDSIIDDVASEEGSLLLDFIIQRSHFRDTAPPTLFDEVMAFIKSEMEVDTSGVHWLHADEEELVVMK